MAQSSTAIRFLQCIRIALIVFSTLVFVGLVYLTSQGSTYNGIRTSFFSLPFRYTWYIWLHLILSLVGSTIYSISMRPHSYMPRGARLVLLFCYSCLWTVFPSYRINAMQRSTALTTVSFFDIWFCGTFACKIQFFIDIISYLVAILGLTEVYFADRYEAAYLYGKQAVTNTTIILAPVVNSTPGAYQPLDNSNMGYQPYPQQQPVAGSPYYPQSGYQPVHSASPAQTGYY